MEWTAKKRKELIEGIYEGRYSLLSLPAFLFEMTFNSIISFIERGFGGGVTKFDPVTERYKIATKFRDNCNVFSAAKTFQEAKDLSNLAFANDGTKIPFSKYKKLAAEIDKRYNGISSDKKYQSWLKTEQDAAFKRAQSAEKWQTIQEDKEIFPLLQYNTVGDSRVRPDHAEHDGKIFPVDHPFWNVWFPPNDWNCRCDTDQIEEGEVTKIDKVPENPVKLFSDNAGKSHIIFIEEGNKQHPYFKVDEIYKTLQNDNNFKLGYL